MHPLLFFFFDDEKHHEQKANTILKATPIESEPDRTSIIWSDIREKTEKEKKELPSPTKIMAQMLEKATRIDIELIDLAKKEAPRGKCCV